MAIQFFCPSGHRLSAPDGHVGRKVRCPACRQVAIVPDRSVTDGPGKALTKEAAPAKAEDSENAEPCEPLPPKSPPSLPKAKQRPPELSLAKEPPPPGAKPQAAADVDEAVPEARDDKAGGRKKPPQVAPVPPPPPAASTEPPPAPPPKDEGDERSRRRRGRRHRRRHEGPEEPAEKEASKKEQKEATREPEKPRAAGRARFGRQPKAMGRHVYRPDRGHLQTIRWLGFFLGLIMLFTVAPAVPYVNVESAPGWARLVLATTAGELVFVIWMLATPDWASVWVVMLVFGFVSTLYAVATSLVAATPLDVPLPLGLGQVRSWFGTRFIVAALAVQCLGTYLCGHISTRWHHFFQRARAGLALPQKP